MCSQSADGRTRTRETYTGHVMTETPTRGARQLRQYIVLSFLIALETKTNTLMKKSIGLTKLVERLEEKRAELGDNLQTFGRKIWTLESSSPNSGTSCYEQTIHGKRGFPSSRIPQAATLLGISINEAKRLWEPVKVVEFVADSEISSDELKAMVSIIEAVGGKVSMSHFFNLLELNRKN